MKSGLEAVLAGLKSQIPEHNSVSNCGESESRSEYNVDEDDDISENDEDG